MMTVKASMVLILAYVLALAAGTTSGLLADRLRTSGPGASSAPLAVQLKLSSEQAGQIRTVWEDVSKTDDDCLREAQKIQAGQVQALLNLLTDEQKAKFGIMNQDFARQFAELAIRRQAAFKDGLSKTEAMLTPEQRTKYEQIVQQRLGDLSKTPGGNPALEDVKP
jgi:Spy/CpxP family protein refolding chaperone